MGGVSAGYSKYDASSFAVTHFNFKGDTKFIELNTKWNPLGTEFKNIHFHLLPDCVERKRLQVILLFLVGRMRNY